jgi:hypothetical protein
MTPRSQKMTGSFVSFLFSAYNRILNLFNMTQEYGKPENSTVTMRYHFYYLRAEARASEG